MITGDDMHVPTCPLNQTGVIGRGGDIRAAAGVSVLEHVTQEPLRGLDSTQRLTIRRRQHAALGVHHLDRVGHREAGDDGRMACAHGADDPGEQVRRRKASGYVMNQHDGVVVVQCRQPCLHRSRAIHPSGHDVHPGVLTIQAVEAGDPQALVDMGAGSHDDHVSHLPTTKNAPERVSQ